MKKSLFFAAAAALLALTSCEKESTEITFDGNDPVFKARIATSTRTTITTGGIVSWVLNDEVSISDGTHTVIYVASSVNGNEATLTKKAGEEGTLNPSGTYTATYGTAPSTEQFHTGSIPSLPMTAQTSDGSFSFSVTCGVLKLHLETTANSISKIAVSNGSTTYTLSCYPTVSISSGNSSYFYIALPVGNYTSITFRDGNDMLCNKVIKDDKTFTITKNEIRPLNFTGESLSFSTPYSFPTGTLPGIFSVSPTKQVRFSQGNLQYQASGTGTWRFAENQYDFIGNAAGNTTTMENGRATQSAWIDLFGWGTTGVNLKKNVPPYCVTSDYADYSSKDGVTMTRAEDDKSDWGVCMGNGWFTLTENEWSFLVGNTSPRATSKRLKSLVEVTPGNYVKGLLLMPDNWTGSLTATTDNDTWKNLESAGGVFLPFDGRRETTTVNYMDQGYYWASNNANGNDGRVLFLKNDANTITMQGNNRRYGASVRLVIEN